MVVVEYNMRIALIYTGHLRTWEKCKENHKQNIWSENTFEFWHVYKNDGCADPRHSIIPGEFYQMDGITHKYNTRRRPEACIAQSLNQWHNMFIGFCIVPKDYDVYVRIRPDIIFNNRIDFSRYDYGNNIYIPEGSDYGGINDQFAFGNYEVMKKYYSVYLNHKELWEEGVEFHTETMMLANLLKQGINIIRIPVTQQILREQSWQPTIVI